MNGEVDIESVYSAIKLAEKYIHEIKGKVIILIGNSGVGKSTSLMTLNGKQMEAYSGPSMQPLLVNKGHTIPSHPRKDHTEVFISDNYMAGTTLPSYLPLKDSKGQVFLYDNPGLWDNRGIAQKLINIYYINRLFDLHKQSSIFFAIKAEYLDPSDRGIQLKNTCMNLLQMFGSISSYEKSLAIVVTQANPLLQEDIVRKIFADILEQNKDVKANPLLVELFNSIINKKIPILIIPFPKIPDNKKIEKNQAIDVTSQYTECIKKARNIIDKLKTTSFNEVQMPKLDEENLLKCICFVERTQANIAKNYQSIVAALKNFISSKYQLQNLGENRNYSELFSPIAQMKIFISKFITIAEEGKLLKNKSDLFDKFNELKVLCFNYRQHSTQQLSDSLEDLKNQFIMVNFLMILRFGGINSNKYKWIQTETVIKSFLSELSLIKNMLKDAFRHHDRELNKQVENFSDFLVNKYLQKISQTDFFKIWKDNSKAMPSVLLMSYIEPFENAIDFFGVINKQNQFINANLDEIVLMKSLFDHYQKEVNYQQTTNFFSQKIKLKIQGFYACQIEEALNYHEWSLDQVKANLQAIRRKQATALDLAKQKNEHQLAKLQVVQTQKNQLKTHNNQLFLENMAKDRNILEVNQSKEQLQRKVRALEANKIEIEQKNIALASEANNLKTKLLDKQTALMNQKKQNQNYLKGNSFQKFCCCIFFKLEVK